MADIAELITPAKHARIELTQARGGKLLYIVSTEVVQLTQTEYAQLVPKTASQVSNLPPQLRTLDDLRIPW